MAYFVKTKQNSSKYTRADAKCSSSLSANDSPLLKTDLLILVFSYTFPDRIYALRLVNKIWLAAAAECSAHWVTLMCKTFCPMKSLLSSFKSGSFFPTYYDKSFEKLDFTEQVSFIHKVLPKKKESLSAELKRKHEDFQTTHIETCRAQLDFIEKFLRPALSPQRAGSMDFCINEEAILKLMEHGVETFGSAFLHHCLARPLGKLMAIDKKQQQGGSSSLMYYEKAYSYNFLAFANLINSVQSYASKLFFSIANNPDSVNYEILLSIIVPFRWEKYCSEGMLLNHDYRNFVFKKDFDTITARVRDHLVSKLQLSGPRHPVYVISDICEILFRADSGFKFKPGEKYYQASNSFLDVMLMKGDCIPITMTLVLVIVCKRLGIRNLRPVGMPGHFIAGYMMPSLHDEKCELYDGEFIRISNRRFECDKQEDRYQDLSVLNETFFVDSFSGGKILTRQDCYAIMTNRVFQRPMGQAVLDGYLEETSPLLVLQRVINNILNLEVDRYQQFFSVYGLLTLQLMISKFSEQEEGYVQVLAMSRIQVICWILSPHPHMENFTGKFNSKVAGLKLFEARLDNNGKRRSLLDIVRDNLEEYKLPLEFYSLRATDLCNDDAVFYFLTGCKRGETVPQSSKYYKNVAIRPSPPGLRLTKPSIKSTPEDLY